MLSMVDSFIFLWVYTIRRATYPTLLMISQKNRGAWAVGSLSLQLLQLQAGCHNRVVLASRGSCFNDGLGCCA